MTRSSSKVSPTSARRAAPSPARRVTTPTPTPTTTTSTPTSTRRAARAAPERGDAGQTYWRALPGAAEELEGGGPPSYGDTEAVGRALQLSFAALLQAAPPDVNTVAEVTRWLDLNRSICQRISAGVREASDGLGVIERFPGVRGTEQFAKAVRRRGAAQDVAEAAERALAEYAALISRAGGSQARLVSQIEMLRVRHNVCAAGDIAPPAPQQLRWRRQAYHADVALTGQASTARVELVIVGPDRGGRGGGVTTASATGMIGVEAAPWAMPLTRRNRLPGLRPVPGRDAAGRLRPAGGVMMDLLLPSFCTDPLPTVTTRTEGETLVQLFAPDEIAMREPFDVVAALAFDWRWGHPKPAREDANFYSVGRVIGPPTQRLVFDVYLHDGLLPARSVSAHVLRTGTQGSLGNARPRSRWYDRLPGDVSIELLSGPGRPGGRGSAAYARLGELTTHLVETMGWQDVGFSGYRVEVEYPLFNFEYVIAAEF